MPVIRITKNNARYVVFPMVDSASPESYKTGLTVADDVYYKDGAGAWTSLAITDTVSEIGATGLYALTMTAAEANHDQFIIKLTAAGAADTCIIYDANLSPDFVLGVAGTVTGNLVVISNVELYQVTEAPTISWTVTDTDGNPVDLSDSEVRLIVHTASEDSVLGEWNTDDGSPKLVVSGADSNVVTFTYTDVITAAAGLWIYKLWRIKTDADQVMFAGMFVITPALKTTPA